MAVSAEELLAGSSWVPEPLRTPGRVIGATSSVSEPSPISAVESVGEETALIGYETAMVDPEGLAEDARALAEQQPVAAE
jgi:ParB family transcriptional regulator, chromosome partitioning protein